MKFSPELDIVKKLAGKMSAKSDKRLSGTLKEETFAERNFRGKKLSRLSRILGEFAKVISAKNSAKADSRKFFLSKKYEKQ